MGRTDGQAQLGAGQDSQGGTERDRETARGRHERDVVAKRGHDAVAIGQQTNVNSNTTIGQDPGRDRGARDIDGGVLPDVVNSSQGTDGVSNIVRSVGKGRETGGQDLKRAEELLGLGVVLG